ncbi:MAG: hypothetical protein JWR16_3312 [Nevskia sp.]|nr:hypothetical protein [Nevskia sp.]
MSLRYYDSALGKARLKRRYVWAAYGFIAGMVLSTILVKLL